MAFYTFILGIQSADTDTAAHNGSSDLPAGVRTLRDLLLAFCTFILDIQSADADTSANDLDHVICMHARGPGQHDGGQLTSRGRAL